MGKNQGDMFGGLWNHSCIAQWSICLATPHPHPRGARLPTSTMLEPVADLATVLLRMEYSKQPGLVD